jgi:monofunctional biosynthetic peptidoglycan transglycosylase
MVKRSFGARVVRAGLACVLAWLLASIGVVLLLRFLPVPFSAIMAQRRVEAWVDGKPYRALHRWTPQDQNFPDHFGFDWQAIEKAIAHNERSRRKRGASTVSQQTAKNLFLWESRSWVRKGVEVYFTLLLETLWPKRRILEVYLNIVEFGDGVYGVEAASRRFFGRSASAINPGQAALLAAVLPNPHRFRADAPSPYVRGRQEWILGQMRMMGGEQVVRSLSH